MTDSPIHPTAIIHPRATLGKNIRVGAFSIIGEQVVMGDDNIIHSHVVIDGHTTLGNGNEIFPFALLGSKPLDKKYQGEPATLTVGDHNQIREYANMTIGTESGGGITKVGSRGLFMTGAHISHDVVVGDDVILVNNATLGGHVIVEDFAIVGGHSAVHQYVRIGKHAMVGGMSGIANDVPPYSLVYGPHATMQGANLVGLKRKKISPDEIKALQRQLFFLFSKENNSTQSLTEKIETLKDEKNNLLQEILTFLQKPSHRGITPADF